MLKFGCTKSMSRVYGKGIEETKCILRICNDWDKKYDIGKLV